MSNKNKTVFSFMDPNTGALMHKQYDFYCNVIAAARGLSDYRIFHFGGGIRGGKTYTCLFALISIANEFPGVKIHIVRDTMPNCMRTVMESLLKLCGGYKNFYQGRDNPHIEFHNGSRIFLLAENYNADKDLDRFKGLETNIFFLEQIEEMQEKTFNKAIERAGTELFDGMPPGLILTTFNPTNVRWVREMVFNPWKIGKPLEKHYTVMATAEDNPYIPEELKSNWLMMDQIEYKRMVLGDWNTDSDNRVFAYSFNEEKHVKPIKRDGVDVYISFDFNVDPSVALMAYVEDKSLRIFKEFKIKNSNVYELCQDILSQDIKGNIYITGDASGNNRSHNLPDNLTTYDIIKKHLRLSRYSVNVPRRNMGLRDSRRVCNRMFEHYTIEIDPSCKSLIEDLLTVEADDKGGINKKDKSKTHLLDCFRYYCNTYFTKLVLGDNYIQPDV